MARSESGRIVVDLEPDVKRELYASLALEGVTLKDWFTRSAKAYAAESMQPLLFPQGTDEVRRARTRKPDQAQTHSVVSMFSGCGGMDLGFRGGFEVFGRKYPKHPFKIVWANDLNEAACRTYENNLRHPIICGDVWKAMESLPSKTDVLIGGFPCQDISINGKRAGVDGARSGLYRAMVEAIKKTDPKVFVAENVKGLLMRSHKESLEKVISDFNSLGYSVSYRLYNAADYGVPQTRERVFIVGVKPDCFLFHPPRPERTSETWMTSREAIGDLINLPESPDINHVWSRANKSPEQGNRRIREDRPGHTIRAECHGNIQFHYNLPRRLSMREAARFQSFPDNFVFASKLRETERQVGNAVPPVLAWHIASSVLRCFEV